MFGKAKELEEVRKELNDVRKLLEVMINRNNDLMERFKGECAESKKWRERCKELIEEHKMEELRG